MPYIVFVIIFFCPWQGAGISGIKVHRITRVHNRSLRARFDDKLDQMLDRSDVVDLTMYEPIVDRLLSKGVFTSIRI